MKSMVMNARTTAIATVIAAMLLSLAAFAGEAPEEDATKKPADEKSQEATAQKKPACELQTGSRIRPRKENDCASSQRVRTWTKDDIETTGESNLADALRKLDPAFR